MLPTDTQIRLPSTIAPRLESDRQRGHQAVMTMLPDDVGPLPRASTDTLWRIDCSTATLTVRTTAALAPTLGAVVRVAPVIVPEQGSTVEVRVDLCCTKTPPSDVPEELRPILKQGKAYRSRPVIVPEDERPAWATRRLAAVGLTVLDLEVSTQRRASLGRRGGSIPFVTVTAHATVTDATAFESALRKGVGKGRNFGLGLIHLTAPQNKG